MRPSTPARTIAGLAVLLLAVAGLVTIIDRAGASATFQPTFQAVECPQELVHDEFSTNSCGYLTVLENRVDPAEGTIRLFVLQAAPLEGETLPDPIFIPGRDLAAERSVPFFPWGYRFGRAVISMDRRGAGRSEPSLACPEVRRLTDAASGIVLGSDEMRAALLDAVEACHDRLTAEGIDLNSYNVAEMAADAEDLRIALEVDEWNVQTYGTASAISFEILRRYPEHVRAAVFDSPLPPQVDRFTEAVEGTEYAFDQIVATCSADTACGRRYPHLRTAWNQALRNLHEHPSRFSDEDLDIVVDDATAVRYLRNNMAQGINETSDIAEFPLAVYELRRHGWQNGGPAGNEVGWASAPPLHVGYEVQWGDPFDLHFGYDPSRNRPTEGTFYSYMCHDEVPFVDQDALERAAGDRPWYVEAYVQHPYLEICQRWNVLAAEEDPHTPVSSDVPVLVLSGQFDPYSPFPLVRHGVKGLADRLVVRVPARSRNVFSADCASLIREAFITDPAARPDTSCLSAISEVLPIDFLPPPPPTRDPRPGEAVITTVAGDGAYGSSGDGSLATGAQLAWPENVVVDADGNLYVVEFDGGRVRRVNPSGRISTVVGPPTGVAPAPQGNATTVDLVGPTALAIDREGDLYVGGGNGTHRMITRVDPASGVATIIAGTGEKGFSGDGGPATEAELTWVRDIAVDDKGNVFFSDYENHRIRMVDAAGVITTIAGTGQKGFAGDGGPATEARLNKPWGVAVDSRGSVYFVDRGNDRVRRIDRHGVIDTVAGNGRDGYSGDEGPAIKADLGDPNAVLVDDQGNLYVASRYCGCIRMIDPDGIITTVAGTGTLGFSGDGGPATKAQLAPTGLAFGPDGALYVANPFGVSRVRKIVFPEISLVAPGRDVLVCSGNPGTGPRLS